MRGVFLAQHAESSTAHHVPVMTSNPACKNMYPVCAGLKVPHAPDTHAHTHRFSSNLIHKHTKVDCYQSPYT